MRLITDFKILDQFTKMFGTRPDINIFKQISNQLNDINHFINVINN